jgi:hypothetical protein
MINTIGSYALSRLSGFQEDRDIRHYV